MGFQTVCPLEIELEMTDLEALVVAGYAVADDYSVPCTAGRRPFLGLIGHVLPGWFRICPTNRSTTGACGARRDYLDRAAAACTRAVSRACHAARVRQPSRRPAGLAVRIAQRILARTIGMLLNTLNSRPERALAGYNGR